MRPDTIPTADLPPWQERARDKQSRILASVPTPFIHEELSFSETDTDAVLDVPAAFLSGAELEITALRAEELVHAIAEGKYSAVEVLDAFTHRAVIAHQLLHCCLDFMYPAARAKAQELDDYFVANGKTVGPMHGLPISVKDQVRVVGTETTCGFVSNLGKKDTEDALLVEILTDAGAIIFTKTSLSVGCMWGETVNNIIGRTSNPYNRFFSCGGSSGGEGALIAFHGSPLGVGSDLGGSIRSPSAYNGLWGLRPSAGRIPYHKILNSLEGQETISSVIGPMSVSPRSLELFARTVIESEPWLTDPKCIPIPWRVAEASQIRQGKKLRIGVMDWDGIILPQPPVRRAIKELAKKLEAAGHEIVPWRIDAKRALELTVAIFSSDANGDIDRTIALSGEPPLDMLSKTVQPPLTLLESWAVAFERQDFQASVLKQWRETATANSPPIDVYLTPVNPSVCPRHGDYSTSRYIAYTATVNLLDFTACAIPVTRVKELVDRADAGDGETDAKGNSLPRPTCELDRKIRSNYDPEVYKGLPVGVQIVGKRLEEEKVLAIAEVIGELLDG